uniref:Uncharacterized protein n=1 Tax=Anguilla anguilla TaxID=7936 RepID=A0A0E9TJX3_ANGAN
MYFNITMILLSCNFQTRQQDNVYSFKLSFLKVFMNIRSRHEDFRK